MHINTVLINMDVLVNEHIVSNPDGSYTILLNARHTRERQMKAYLHALSHILGDDFEKSDADAIELAAHDNDRIR